MRYYRFEESRKKLYFLFAVWAIPVAFFLEDPSYSPQAWPTWLAAFISLFLGLHDIKYLTFSLPFFALLSPLAISNKVLNLLPSELFVFLCLLILLIIFLIKGVSTIKLRSGELYLLWMLVIVFISFFFSFEYDRLIKSIISWCMIFTVFWLTRATIKSIQDVSMYFTAIIISTFFSSLISYSSFIKGISLASYISPPGGIIGKQYYDSSQIEWFFRASNFYTNISFVIGPAALIALVRIFTTNKVSSQLLYILFYANFVGLLLIMMEKTGLVSLLFSSLSLIFLFTKSDRQNSKKRVSKFLSIFIILMVILLLYEKISSDINYDLNLSSFSQRLIVYSSTLEVISQNPMRLFFGFGPDATNLIQNDIISSAKTSSSGSVEGAIDSGYMTFLFEYGFIFILLFFAFVFNSIYRLIKQMKSQASLKSIYVTIVCIIIFININALTDVVGTSKMAWVIAQIFAVSGFCISKNVLEKQNTVI